MRPSIPKFLSLSLLYAQTPIFVSAYTDDACCNVAQERDAFVSLEDSSPIPASDVICGQLYDEDIPPAPNAFIPYGFCKNNCGGWGISDPQEPKQWALPVVGFLLPSIVFCANIPRRLELVSSTWLEIKVLGNRRGLGRALLALLLTLPTIFLTTLDTVAWIIVTIAMAGPMTVSGLHEALLDFKILKALKLNHHESCVADQGGKRPKDPEKPTDAGSNNTEYASAAEAEAGVLPPGKDPSPSPAPHHSKVLRCRVQLLLTVLCGNISLDSAAGSPMELISKALLSPRQRRAETLRSTGSECRRASTDITLVGDDPQDDGVAWWKPRDLYCATFSGIDKKKQKKKEEEEGEEGEEEEREERGKPAILSQEQRPGLLANIEHYQSMAEQLKRLLVAHVEFGASVGAPVVFYLGSFVYSILEVLDDRGDQDAAYAVAFGVEWMIIVNVAIVSGVLLASRDPSPVTMLVGLPPPPKDVLETESEVRKFKRRFFPPMYDGVFQPVSMWRRGINKADWLECCNVWKESAAFRKHVRVSPFEAIVWIVLPTLVLISMPPITGAVVSWRTPPSGWGCRSLSFVTYGTSQIILTPAYFASSYAEYFPRSASASPSMSMAMTMTVVRSWVCRFFRAIFGLMFFLAVFTGIGTTMMQFMGVYRNCLCYVNSEDWLDLDRALVNVAADTAVRRDSSDLWMAMGAVATAFMALFTFAGWRYQTNLRIMFEKVIRDIDVDL